MDQQEGDTSSIERLRKRLYARGAKFGGRGRRSLRRGRGEDETPEEWKREYRRPASPREERSYLSLFFIGSVAFFVLAVLLSTFFFFSGSDVSPRNIDIKIEGPVSAGGGEELSLAVTITNRNPVAIELADLLVEYPEGTRSASDQSVELLRSRESLGTVRAGESVERTIRSVLFGPEGSEAVIGFSLEYRIDGSNAIFVAEDSYRLLIASAPLSLTIDALREVTSGQEIEFKATVTSNSSSAIKSVLLSVEYPFGFTYSSASPAPSFGQSVFSLGDIEPEGERTIAIRGVMKGEDGDERVFRFASGIGSSRDEGEIATAFITSLESVLIKKPFVAVTLSLLGSTADPFTAVRGGKIRADISWFNNLPVNVTDAQIEVRLKGAALDRNSVSVDRGFYRSVDNTVIWSKETYPSLSLLSPGETGSVSFSFATLPLSAGSILPNTVLVLEVDVAGRRLSADRVPETIESSITRTVKIATDLLFTSRAVHFTGPFQNSGPIPPQADRETTYTVLWTIENSANAVANAQVTATLPSYVRWMGVLSPASESVEWNPIGGQITWTIGDMEGAGSGKSTRSLAFQVALLPSLPQVGASPILVNTAEATARDRFTGDEVETTVPPATTRISTDPNWQNDYDRVVP